MSACSKGKRKHTDIGDGDGYNFEKINLKRQNADVNTTPQSQFCTEGSINKQIKNPWNQNPMENLDKAHPRRCLRGIYLELMTNGRGVFEEARIKKVG